MSWEFILLLLFFCASLNAQDLRGSWLGTFRFLNAVHPIRIELENSDKNWKGSADLLLDGIQHAELSSLKVDGEQLEFTVKLGQESLAFSGQSTKAQSIDGKVVSGENTGDFQLTQIANIPPAELSKLFGVYKLENDEYVYLRTWDELGSGQFTAFHSDGSIRALYPRSSTEYFSGPGLLIPSPETSSYSFQKNRIEYREGSNMKSGTRVEAIREIEIEIPNNERKIHGSLVLPDRKGPHSAVVLVHGSGAVSRDFLGPLAYVFAQKGIAALTYDKRKDWMDSSFEDLAEDAASAFRYLRMRSEIDSTKVGYLGASQGGWIAPLAASREPGASFLILFSGPAVTPAEHEFMRTREEARVEGASEEEIKKMVEGLHSQLAELRTEEARVEFEKQLGEWMAAGKSKELEQSEIGNPRFLLWYRSIMDYDPVPVLIQTKIPVLALYGELDLGVPPQENIEPLKKHLSEAGNKNLQVHVLPRANHVLLESKTGSRTEFPHLDRFTPGLFELMTNWILKLKALK